MKKILFCCVIFLVPILGFGQLEISSGFAISDGVKAMGAPILLGYDFKLKNRLFTKTQLDYKYLYAYNNFVMAKFILQVFGVHQTLSYELIKKNKYIFKPNVGINYRYYILNGEMTPPYEPGRRGYHASDRNGNYRLTSYDQGQKIERHTHALGFSFQLQNQFWITENLWMHITPFIEPDYDSDKMVSGVYVGLIFKNL